MKVQRRNAALAFVFLSLIAASPRPAVAFETVDTIPWPSAGAFPAYGYDTSYPTGLSARFGLLRDSNLVRQEANRASDTVTRAGVAFRHDQRVIGRQRLIVEASGDAYYFDRFDDLNHFAYSALGDWRWEIGNNLSGSVVLGRTRRQADITETRAPVSDPVTTTRVGASGGYLVTPNVRLHAGVSSASAERRRAAETETQAASWNAGIDYVSPLGNTLGVDYRRTTGDAPVPEFVAPAGTFVNNDFRDTEVALVAAYTSLVQFRLVGRIGRTTRDYTELTGRNFEGTTGRVALEWLPGNKTILGFEAYKAPQSVVDIAAGHIVIRGVAFGPRWAATNKLVFSARMVREKRTFEGDPLLSFGAPLRSELLSLIRLGVGWEPRRHWQVGFGFDHGERASNFVGRDYQFNTLMANVTWTY
jgi:hypothetical protein